MKTKTLDRVSKFLGKLPVLKTVIIVSVLAVLLIPPKGTKELETGAHTIPWGWIGFGAVVLLVVVVIGVYFRVKKPRSSPASTPTPPRVRGKAWVMFWVLLILASILGLLYATSEEWLGLWDMSSVRDWWIGQFRDTWRSCRTSGCDFPQTLIQGLYSAPRWWEFVGMVGVAYLTAIFYLKFSAGKWRIGRALAVILLANLPLQFVGWFFYPAFGGAEWFSIPTAFLLATLLAITIFFRYILLIVAWVWGERGFPWGLRFRDGYTQPVLILSTCVYMIYWWAQTG
jgi:hypothetical protein